MAIKHASEHAGTVSEYCTPNKVREYLAGTLADDEGDAFEGIWSGSVVEKKLNAILPVVKQRIDDMVGHDISYHEDVDIVVDGTESPTIFLSRYGFVPLISVSSITVDEEEKDVDDFEVYPDGRVVRKNYTLTSTLEYFTSWAFEIGKLNVEMTITWGYDSVPSDIEYATALLAGAELLRQAAVVESQQMPGIPTNARIVKYGDYTVTHVTSSYETTITSWTEQAKRLCEKYMMVQVASPDLYWRDGE